MKSIIISPIHNHYMSGRIWMGLDTDIISKKLNSLNYNVKEIPFQNLADKISSIPSNSIFFYAVTYNANYLSYIRDTIEFITLKRPDIVIIPDIHQLKSLDNKGYQEYYKKFVGIERVRGKYYGDVDDLFKDNIKYPFVLKENKGALSSGVHLIHSKSELEEFSKKINKKNIKESLSFRLNKYNSFKKDMNLLPNENLLETNFNDVFRKRTPLIYQEFIPNLNHDFKVLQFGNKYYCLKRLTRDNDFRASGSGKVEFSDAPIEVLNYARNIVSKLKTPFISLDIGMDNNKNCYLFEYQGVAFGPLTLTKSKFFYTFVDSTWKKTISNSNLEMEYALAIHNFIKESENENN